MARRTKAEVRIVAKDEASKEVKKAQTGFEKFGKFLTVGFAAATAAAIAAIRGLGAAFERSVAASAAQETALEGLRSQLSDLGPATDRVTESLAAFAAERQKVTTFGDEVTIQAQQQLAVFAKSEEALKALTVATQDFATAQGINLNDAAKLLGKTLGSSTNALTRYGIEVEGAVGSTERLESLTGNLADLFGGRATDATNTYAGALKQLENAQGDTSEAIGESATRNQALIEVIKERTEAEQNLTFALNGGLTALGALLVAWNKFLLVMTKVQIEVSNFFHTFRDGLVLFGLMDERVEKTAESMEDLNVATKETAKSTDVLIDSTKAAEEETKIINELRGILTETTEEATEAQEVYNEEIGNQEPAAAFVRGQEAIQNSLRTTAQLIASTTREFDELARTQGRAAAVAAGIAGGGRLVQGGRVLEFAGGSRLTSTPGLSGGLSDRRTGSFSNLNDNRDCL